MNGPDCGGGHVDVAASAAWPAADGERCACPPVRTWAHRARRPDL